MQSSQKIPPDGTFWSWVLGIAFMGIALIPAWPFISSAVTWMWQTHGGRLFFLTMVMATMAVKPFFPSIFNPYPLSTGSDDNGVKEHF